MTVSASLAFLGKVPLERVMQAASWKYHNTFTSFYWQDVESDEALGYLSLVAAQTRL